MDSRAEQNCNPTNSVHPGFGILGMFVIRSALAVVFVVGVQLCPLLGLQGSKASTTRIDTVTVGKHSPLIAFALPSEPPRTVSISPFSPWRYRMKGVLGETTNPPPNDFDLGPAVLPNHQVGVSLEELMSRCLPTGHPLRC